MGNEHIEFSEITTIYQVLERQLERMTLLDKRVFKIEMESLDKDRLIKLLSSENERLKEEIADHLGVIEELRELNDELDNQVERLSGNLNLRKLK
jgi:Mg2+ and Co2+ transporter CorA